LFTRFLADVQSAEGCASPHLTPAECRDYLPMFIEKSLREAKISSWEHLIDIIKYENMFLDVGEPSLGKKTATVDLCCLDEYLPLREESTVVCDFNWNIADIVCDLKNGVYRDHYEKEASVIVALRKEAGIELTEINDFGRDMLHLSNGSTPLDEIAGMLYKRYGEGMDVTDFIGECRTALAQLVEMGTIVLPAELQDEN